MNIIPETRGATLLSTDATGTITEWPIVGWAYVQGNRLDPLFDMVRRSGIGPNEGIRRVDEKGFAVVSVPSLNELMLEDEFYSHMQSIAMSGGFEDLAESAAAVVETETKHLTPGAALSINFTDDTFKTKSYWKFDDARSLFEIEKQTALPADKRCEKVSRDEYAALKKDGYKVIDPHNWPPVQTAAEIIRSAADAIDATPEDEDAGEGMDLI